MEGHLSNYLFVSEDVVGLTDCMMTITRSFKQSAIIVEGK